MNLVEYEPALVEEAVLHALWGHSGERAFRRKRDRLYEVRDPEAREAVFRELHAAWFAKLGLGQPVAQAIHEQPIIAAATQGCRTGMARSREEEGAELFVRPSTQGLREPDRRWVVIRLRPEIFGDPDRLLQFLRHELFHIADMLNPSFGYQPHLPSAAAGPAHERLLRDRYRVLWDVTIDGRLACLARAPASVRAERLRDFVRSFPMLGSRTDEAFARFFDGDAVSHAEMAAFAGRPGGSVGGAPEGPRPGERCPLCRFPTHAFEPDPQDLPREILAAIRSDFPTWEPGHALCQQCADLYRTRPLSPSGTGSMSAGP